LIPAILAVGELEVTAAQASKSSFDLARPIAPAKMTTLDGLLAQRSIRGSITIGYYAATES